MSGYKNMYYVRITSNDYWDEDGLNFAWAISKENKLTTTYLNTKLFDTEEDADYVAKSYFKCLDSNHFTYQIIKVLVNDDE